MTTRTTRVVAFVAAVALLLILAAAARAQNPIGSSIFFPIVQRQTGVCDVPDPLPSQALRIVPVTGDGIKMRVTSPCSPDRHVKMRVYHRGTHCPDGCYTGWVPWDWETEWAGLPRLQAWPGLLRINIHVEFWSDYYLSYDVEVQPWQPYESNVTEIRIE